MNGKALPVFGFLFGLVCGYAWGLHRIVTLRDKIDELSQPPRKISRYEWWENVKPATTDEYELLKAKQNWISDILAKYIAPYIDKNVSSLLIQDWAMPVADRLIELESQQKTQERMNTLMFMQKSASGQTDD